MFRNSLTVRLASAKHFPFQTNLTVQFEMAEIVISIGSKLAEYLVAPISKGATYLFSFKEFIGRVEKAKQELEEKLKDVKKNKEEADRKTEEIMPSVKKWLDDVNAILEEVQKLQQELEGGRKKCFNVSHRYSLAKQMENKAKQMTDLKQNSSFEPFSQLIQLPGITYFSSKEFMAFNSRISTYNRLLEAIINGKNKMVGLYGMAGSGKTTLATEVGKKVAELKLFDKIIMVVVSKDPNILNIQQEIAGQIGLQLQEPTQLTKAQRLSEGLKNKKILIILDDVWSKLRLEDIGIPTTGACHILLTTRLRDVCVSMDCKSKIELSLLTEEEAWALFKMHANTTSVSTNESDSIGRKIVDECKGLPIAIVTVGSTLKEKSIHTWRSTLEGLRHPPPLDIEDDLKTPYVTLKVSYDNLPSRLAKSLFILCSMFPEDHEIHIEDLIHFGKGTLKLGERIYTMEKTRDRVLANIEKLLDSCLLMHTSKQAHVKLHDVIRDVALWIAKEQCQEVLVDNQEISKMLIGNHQSLEDTKAVSLWNLDEDFELSKQLHFPKLEILLLQPYGFIRDIGAMESLKVLALIRYGFEWELRRWHPTLVSIPQSIVSLTNLHTLCLRGKNLGDISLLGELKGLEILDLRGSQFDKLPAGIVDMKMLKLLDIFGCQIEKSPLEVIGRCEQLEELYFLDQKSVIPHNFSLSRLKRYVLYDATCSIIGAYGDDPFQEYLDSCGEALRALCIQGFRVSALNSSMKNLILRANHLWLENCEWDYKDINFQINHLGVSCCQEKKFIIEKRDVNILQTQVFSRLSTLRLFEMNSLEQVFQDSSIGCSLPMLQELWIRGCPELRICIFSHATITRLPKLRKLRINRCDKVKWLFSCSLASYCSLLKEIIISNCSEFERLIDEEATHGDPLFHDKQHHPYGKETDSAYVGVTAKRFNQLQNQQFLILFLRLKSLKIERSGKKKGILEIQVRGRVEDDDESIKVQEPLKLDSELSELKLVGLPELEYIWKGPTQIVSLHRLENVSLERCPKLKNIFTLAIVASLPELRRLVVHDCEEWEGIFCEESLKNLSSSNICFPKLKDISIYYCNKVRWLLSYSLAYHCPLLETIRIYGGFELEGLIDEEAAHGDPPLHDMQDHPQQPLILFPKLTKIRIISCNNVRWLLSYSMASLHCPSLELIYIESCFELERLAKEASYGDRLPLLKLKDLYLWSVPKLREIFPHQHENDTARVVKSELWSIFLADLPELEHIWKGPTQILSFHRLEDITLWECPRLRNIFTLAIITSLPELRKLDVRRCDEWEGIFCEESLKNLSTTSTVCFPKLKTIHISDCHKVRRVFSYSLASHCPSLKKLHIWDCCQLEGVVEAYEGEVAAHHHQRLFPELNYLKLSNLPKLREIYEDYEFNLLFSTITIEDCPNISKISKIPLEDKPSSSAVEIKLES